MELTALNINQLIVVVGRQLDKYDEMLSSEIRIVGLRKKTIKRKRTLKKVMKILCNHTD